MSFVGDSAYSSLHPPRDNSRNPRHWMCKLAHRRICGVCAHFDGNLKDKGQRPCKALGIVRHALSGASDCRRFERKNQ